MEKRGIWVLEVIAPRENAFPKEVVPTRQNLLLKSDIQRGKRTLAELLCDLIEYHPLLRVPGPALRAALGSLQHSLLQVLKVHDGLLG
jgi:hypothetical protein